MYKSSTTSQTQLQTTIPVDLFSDWFRKWRMRTDFRTQIAPHCQQIDCYSAKAYVNAWQTKTDLCLAWAWFWSDRPIAPVISRRSTETIAFKQTPGVTWLRCFQFVRCWWFVLHSNAGPHTTTNICDSSITTQFLRIIATGKTQNFLF